LRPEVEAMMFVVLVGLTATIIWLAKPRLGTISDATGGAGVSGDD
jgi:hypothetical protein